MVNVPSCCHWPPTDEELPTAWRWLTSTVRRSVDPSKTENGASLAYDGERGIVTHTRYCPAAKPVKLQVAVAKVLSFFWALLANWMSCSKPPLLVCKCQVPVVAKPSAPLSMV